MSSRTGDIVGGIGTTNVAPVTAYEAIIANTVTAVGQDLFVKIPSIDQGASTKGPLRWNPVSGPGGISIFPTQGDIAQVTRTQEGYYWLNQFIPAAYPSAPLPSWETGDIKATARLTASSGWLICDGSSVTTTDPLKAALRAALIADGSRFGTSGSDPLLPANGKFFLGASGSHVVGTNGGAETVTLALSDIPSHSHKGSGVGGGGGTTNSADRPLGHNHRIDWQSVAAGGSYQGLVTGVANVGSTAFGDGAIDHLHQIFADGGGGSHNNMPPWVAVTYEIKL